MTDFAKLARHNGYVPDDCTACALHVSSRAEHPGVALLFLPEMRYDRAWPIGSRTLIRAGSTG
jgi:hypothetical protein